jgi:hypothetical protein
MAKRKDIQLDLLPETLPPKVATGKIAILVGLLRQPGGATLEAMMAATGWQAHSVRGAISGSIKKALGLAVVSEKIDGARTYRIEAEA